jgi:hypothetical protein
MPKNTKGGNKAKKMKNSSAPERNREVPFPEDSDDSHVAIITKVCGDLRYLCQIVDTNGTQIKLYTSNLSTGTRNKYGRGMIISIGTYVLIAIREFQKDKADIIFIYKDSEKSVLVENNYISNLTNSLDGANDDIEFSNNIRESSNIKISNEDISINKNDNIVSINTEEFDFSEI